MKRLYVVVRGDLPVGLQMAQACHAAREFAFKFWEQDVGENLVVLQAKNEGHLLRLWVENDEDGERANSVLFREPDLGNEFTAFAASGKARRHLSALPLAGKAYVKPDVRQT